MGLLRFLETMNGRRVDLVIREAIDVEGRQDDLRRARMA
jgi:hypothetical protein